MQTKHWGGAIDTDENAVAVSACGDPSASRVVTTVTPAAKEAIASLKSSALTLDASMLYLYSLTMQLPQELVVGWKLGREFRRFALEQSEHPLRLFTPFCPVAKLRQ